MQMETKIPARKVMASTLGAALATIIIYVVQANFLNEDLPVHVVGAIQLITVFAAGYLVPPSANDRIVDPTMVGAGQ